METEPEMNFARTALLLAAMTGLFVGVGYLIGGQAGMVIAFVIALGMNFFAYWNSDKMVLRMYGAQEVGRRRRIASIRHRPATWRKRGNLPMPKVYLIADGAAQRLCHRPQSRARRRRRHHRPPRPA